MTNPPEMRMDALSQDCDSLSQGSDLPRARHAVEKHIGFLSFLTRRRLVLALVSLLLFGAIASYTLRPGMRPNQVAWSGDRATTEARNDWHQALLALDRHDFLLAKTHLARCLEVWPIHAETHFLMARTCRRAGDEAGWQAHFRKAEILGWDKSAVDLERELRQAQSGNLRGVENGLLSRLDSFPPEEELILEALAEGYLKTDHLNAVLELTRQWIERYPDHWEPKLFRARALLLAHSVDQAIAEYGRILKLKADHPEAHLELAGALLANSQFQEAAEHFRIYLAHQPNDSAALVRLANCQLSLGQTEAARASLDRLFIIHPEDAAGFFVRAKLELAAARPDGALHWLKRAESLAPHETDITYSLVLVLQQLGKQAEAKQYERKLQDLRRQYEQLETVKAKIRGQPDNVVLRDEAAAVSLRLGHAEEAGHWLRSALQLDPNHRPTHKLLAEYFQKLGKADLAAFHRRKSEDK
jgi:tetratricopeptide (TPR) repeat protein